MRKLRKLDLLYLGIIGLFFIASRAVELSFLYHSPEIKQGESRKQPGNHENRNPINSLLAQTTVIGSNLNLEVSLLKLSSTDLIKISVKTELKADGADGNPKPDNGPGADPEGNADTKQFQLTLCTTVKDNVHFIVEWIEFMRLQGVDHFVLYDDGSSDSLDLLSKLYEQVDDDLDLDILPSRKSGLELDGQVTSLQHCLETYGNTTEWMLLSDTDEFLYSPSHGTLKDMLEDLPRLEEEGNFTVDNVYAQCYRFGSSGQQRRFQYHLVEDSGDVRLVNECGDSSNPQLMINQVKRAPFEWGYKKIEEESALHSRLASEPMCANINQVSGTFLCNSGPGKTLFRPRLVSKVGIHNPQLFADGRTSGLYHEKEGSFLLRSKGMPPLAWCNHYWFKSREDCKLRAGQWMQASESGYLKLFDEVDEKYFGVVVDPAVRDRWKANLTARMRIMTRFEGNRPSPDLCS